MFIASPPPFFIFSIIYVQANFVPNYVEEFYEKQKILGGLLCRFENFCRGSNGEKYWEENFFNINRRLILV